MKKTIAWHITCLKNLKEAVDCKRDEIVKHEKELKRMLDYMEKYENQIQTAINRNKDSFDGDTFLVKRKTKEDK